MNPEEFKERTKRFALRVIRVCEALPKTTTGNVLSRQLVSSGTSVGANYRAACRAKSRADFVNKMTIVEEECDESMFWMELIVAANLIEEQRVAELREEANQILSIGSIKTARSKKLT